MPFSNATEPSMTSQAADPYFGIELTTDGISRHQNLPLVIGVLTHLNAEQDASDSAIALRKRSWLSVTQASLDQVLQEFHPSASTRSGLQYLLGSLPVAADVEVKVLNISKDELLQDLQKAVSPDQSCFYDFVIRQGLGTFGASPLSILVCDFEIHHGTADVELLRRMTEIAAQAHAPCLVNAAPQMFSLDSFSDLHRPRELQKIFEMSECVEWLELREQDAAKYLAVTLPNVSTTDTAETTPSTTFNSSYVLAQRIAQAFERDHWPVNFHGFHEDSILPSVETTVSRAAELNDLGFLPICARTGTRQTAVVGAVSTYRSKRYFDSRHERTEQLASTLATTLALSRVIHAVHLMLREETGSLTTCESLQKKLNVWIQRYVKAPNESPSAYHPLSEGSITVTQDLEKHELLVQLRIQPRFRIERLEEPVVIGLTHRLT